MFKEKMGQPYKRDFDSSYNRRESSQMQSSMQLDPAHVQALLQENGDLQQGVRELQEELDYGKQRENKLMFFLFILKEKGFPISEVFEEEIKDIPTTRFSTHFDDEYKTMYY